jgi:hypothetical protein
LTSTAVIYRRALAHNRLLLPYRPTHLYHPVDHHYPVAAAAEVALAAVLAVEAQASTFLMTREGERLGWMLGTQVERLVRTRRWMRKVRGIEFFRSTNDAHLTVRVSGGKARSLRQGAWQALFERSRGNEGIKAFSLAFSVLNPLSIAGSEALRRRRRSRRRRAGGRCTAGATRTKDQRYKPCPLILPTSKRLLTLILRYVFVRNIPTILITRSFTINERLNDKRRYHVEEVSLPTKGDLCGSFFSSPSEFLPYALRHGIRRSRKGSAL